MGGSRAVTRLLAFLALTLPLMPLQQVFIWFWPTMARRFPQTYHSILCKVLAVTIDVQGAKPQVPCLIVVNHVSWLDIVILSAVLPCAFVAKREVGSWPLFGTMARLQRTVFVDRDKRHATAAARDGVADRLAGGETLVLFPEGTSGDGSSVRPFKTSLFGAATSETPIVPASLAYLSQWNMPLTRRQRPAVAWYGDMKLAPHLWQALAAGPIHVLVVFHDTLQGTDRKETAKQAETRVRAGLVSALHGRRDLR
jgi:lyso-ornithine lipid O-acyltransferase